MRFIMRPILISISALTIVTCAALIWFGSHLAEQFQQLDNEWQQYNKQSSKRSQLLNQMHRHIGYGGFIHQFKNLVLRQELSLVPEINSNLTSVYQVINEYISTAGANKKAAIQLRDSIDRYANNFVLTQSLISKNQSAEYIDKHVKVNDKKALEALALLSNHELNSSNKEAGKISGLIDKQLGFLLSGAVIVPLVILFNIWLAVLLIRMRKRKEDFLQLQNVQKILQLLPVPMIVSRKNGSILYVNKATGKLLGYPIEEMANKKVEDFLPSRLRENHITLRQGFMQHNDERYKAKEVVALTSSGSEIPVAINISSIAMPDGNLAIVCINDVTKQKHAELQLQKQVDQYYELSHQDALTKVGNRRYFDDYIKLQFRQSQVSSTPLTLFLIDVDEFKKYNDFYGHPAGDVCLQEIASSIQSMVKRSGDIVARYGGEEFACIFPNLATEDSAAMAETILAAIRALEVPHEKSSGKKIVSVSIGSCSFSGESDFDLSDLVAEADRQLYKAKDSGRDTYKTTALGTSNVV